VRKASPVVYGVRRVPQRWKHETRCVACSCPAAVRKQAAVVAARRTTRLSSGKVCAARDARYGKCAEAGKVRTRQHMCQRLQQRRNSAVAEM